MFLQVSVTGGVYPSMPCRSLGGGVFQHALQVSRPTPKGSLRSLPGGSPGPHWGVSRPTPGGGVSRPTPGGGGVFQHALQVSRPTPKGELEGSGQGGLHAYTGGGVSRSTPRGGVYPSMH